MGETQDLADVTADAVVAIDDSMRVVAWNHNAQDLLGYGPHEAIGRSCYDVLQATHPDGRALCTPSCTGDLCFGRRQPFAVPSCLARHKNGWRVPVRIRPLIAMQKWVRARRTDSMVAVVVLRRGKETRRQPLPEQELRICTFGHFALSVRNRDLAVGKWQRKKALGLLKYLVTHLGRAIHRERLIELLWPEADESRGWERLKVTMYFLRHQLRAAGLRQNVVETAGMAYVLKHEAVWVDAVAFDTLVTKGRAQQHQQRWAEAIDCYQQAQHLYRGDYLEEDLYTDWCDEERERLRETYLEMLASMAESYAELGRFAEAAQTCRTALVREPCDESVHRALMRYLVRLGRTDRAVAQFDQCRRLLAQELDVEPTSATQRLYQQILKEGGGGSQV